MLSSSPRESSRSIDEIWAFSGKHPFPGRLVVIEGFDGSGKSTQLDLLRKRLEAEGKHVLLTRQPTEWYRQQHLVREFFKAGTSVEGARTMALMSAADRALHMWTTVAPALSDGRWVLCDRYVFSALALFQARGLDLDYIININREIIRPDMSFYLDCTPSVVRERILKRDGGRLKIEEQSEVTIEEIMGLYRSFSAHLHILDATKNPNELATYIFHHIEGL